MKTNSIHIHVHGMYINAVSPSGSVLKIMGIGIEREGEKFQTDEGE